MEVTVEGIFDILTLFLETLYVFVNVPSTPVSAIVVEDTVVLTIPYAPLVS
jgi:hypothetical protein